jgi:prevent-host-death family protein
LTGRKVGRSLNRTMRRIQAAGARKHFSSLVTKSAMGERIKVTRYNKTVAVLIPKHDLKKLEECEDGDDDAGDKRTRSSR